MKRRCIGMLFLLFIACDSNDNNPLDQKYTIESGHIMFAGESKVLNGVNALHTFGLEDLRLMDSWNVKIVREFIGNLREQPISGGAVQGSDDKWLHSLEALVRRNRAQGFVTLLCPFGWVNDQGELTLLTGLNPSSQSFYSQYKERMREIAQHFASQSDVWLEVWNEPYHWNNENNYGHELWLTDMTDLVQLLRSIDGFDNILVVPGNEQGQSEEALLEKGHELTDRFENILFDLHAYEKWLNTSSSAIRARLAQLKNSDIPILFGEIGVINVADLMNVVPFLQAAEDLEISTLAWLWKREASDQNALLNENGQANNLNNNHWGSTFQIFLETE